MPETAGKAVFLSYASQDAAAAQRICTALRAAGVEVWFDQSELVGGDAWDAKIKKQIQSCALFVPIISAHTQERREGYFRLEWHLAEDRTRLIAKGTPFVVPVVVDGTSERNAIVPEVFTTVQWTRLPGGDTSTTFVTRVQTLLGRDSAPASATPADADPASLRPAAGKPNRSSLSLAVAALTVVALGIVAFVALRPARQDAAAPSQPLAAAKPAPATAAPVAAGPVVNEKSIAVLPFENRSDEKGNEFFTDGVHDNILTSLTNIGALQVVSRTSVMEYRGTKKKIPQIARELNVAYVLEGSVQRAGNAVRITGQLIRAATDEHVWAKNFDRELSTAGLFAIQSELAQAIAEELKATITPQEKQAIARRPTENLGAYDLYLKARNVVVGSRSRGTESQELETRETLLRAAVELDPKFAVAWAELSRVHLDYKWSSVDTSPARLAKASVAIEKAVALEPDSPAVIQRYYVWLSMGAADEAQARKQLARLLQVAPNDGETYVLLSFSQGQDGRQSAESLASVQKAARLDPRNVEIAQILYDVLRTVRRFGEAKEALLHLAALRPTPLDADEYQRARLAFWTNGSTEEMAAFVAMREAKNSPDVWRRRVTLAIWRGDLAEAVRVDQLHPPPPGARPEATPGTDGDMALIYLQQGNPAAARKRLGNLPDIERRRLAEQPNNTQFLRYLALVEAILGNKEAALAYAEQALGLTPRGLTGQNIRQVLAQVYAIVGDKDRAIAELTHLLQTPSNVNIHELKVLPAYFNLRGDPRFEALVNDPKNNLPLF